MTPASDSSPGRIRLLMIDDDKKLCRLVGDYLSPLGFDVTAEHDGAAGAERAVNAADGWQAVILDVMLPSLDGFEVLRRIRKSSDTPALTTGASPVAALSRKSVPLYSDLLLHDMGALDDGITQGTAGPRDMRTAPLWGLGGRPAYLHDGRTDSLDAAIRAHDGEAAPARTRYTQLDAPRHAQLLAFLRSL